MPWFWLNVATLALWLMLAHRQTRPRLGPSVLGLVATLTAILGASHLMRVTGALPLTWFTALQEGTTLDNLRNLGTVDAHAGENWHLLLWPWTAGHRDAVAVMAANVSLTTTTAVLSGWIGARIARSRGVGLVTALWVGLNPITQQLRFSEQPTPLLGLLLLSALLPWQIWRDPTQPARWRRLGLLALLALGAVISGVRVEPAGVLWTAVTLGLLADGLASPLTRASRRIDHVFSRLADRAPEAWLAVGLATVSIAAVWGVAWTAPGHSPLNPWPGPLSERVGVTSQSAWLVEAINPLNGSWLRMVGSLPGFAPPLGALCILAGLLVGLRHPFRTGGLALSLVLLFRIWTAASHDSLYEMVRYLGPTVPLFGLLGVVGWVAVRRHLGQGLRRLSALAMLIPPWTGFASLTIPWPGGTDALPWPGLLDRDVQREARMLLRARVDHPACLLVTRTTRWSGALIRLPPGTDPLDPITMGEGVLQWNDPGRDVDLLVHQPTSLRHAGTARWPDVLREAPCALYVHSLACNGPAAETCQQEIGRAAFHRALTFKPTPYNHPLHPQPTTPQITLSVHPMDPARAADRITLTER